MITTTVTVILITPLCTFSAATSRASASLPQGSGSAEKRIRPGCDARYVRLTHCEYSRALVLPARAKSQTGSIIPAKNWDSYLWIALTMIPTSRPKYAPIAIDGTKMPAGTLEPYEIMTSKVRMMVAKNSEFTIVH